MAPRDLCRRRRRRSAANAFRSSPSRSAFISHIYTESLRERLSALFSVTADGVRGIAVYLFTIFSPHILLWHSLFSLFLSVFSPLLFIFRAAKIIVKVWKELTQTRSGRNAAAVNVAMRLGRGLGIEK